MTRKTIPIEVERRVREAAGNRCGYCLCPQRLLPWKLEIDHIKPYALGGTDDEWNLWLSCRACNICKGIQTHGYDPTANRKVKLFNPRLQKWFRHFKWSDDGTQVIGLTASGRATVAALKLNQSFAVDARRSWVSAGWHPPTD